MRYQHEKREDRVDRLYWKAKTHLRPMLLDYSIHYTNETDKSRDKNLQDGAREKSA